MYRKIEYPKASLRIIIGVRHTSCMQPYQRILENFAHIALYAEAW
jgi:hypothetical protein